jgi:hypothetical protein
MSIYAQNQIVLNYLWEKQVVLNVVDYYIDIHIATESHCLLFFKLVKFGAQKSFVIEIETNCSSNVVTNI